MSGIPEDLMQAARHAYRDGCNYPAGVSIADGPLIHAIARAIMAREAKARNEALEEAAKVAINEASFVRASELTEYGRGYKRACRNMWATIRAMKGQANE